MNTLVEKIYPSFLENLLSGERVACQNMVNTVLDKVCIEDIYFRLLQPSLYDIGKLWEANKLSVASEHIATAIIEGILNQMFSNFNIEKYNGFKMVMACSSGEFHQVGAKMIADYFEHLGWQTYFIGSNTPISALMEGLDEIKPNLLGLSISIEFNLKSLLETIDAVYEGFPQLDIIIGGGGLGLIEDQTFDAYEHLTLLRGFDELQRYIKQFSAFAEVKF